MQTGMVMTAIDDRIETFFVRALQLEVLAMDKTK